MVLTDEQFIQYIDYMIMDEQLFVLFNTFAVKKTDTVEKIILKNINEFIDDLNIHFDETKNKSNPNEYKYRELDCEDYIEFLHKLIFN